MSLETLNRHNDALFDFLWCPVCGDGEFTHIPFEGVFCSECNTSVRVTEPRETRGYEEGAKVRFDTDPTWNLHKDQKLRRDLPDGEAMALIRGSPGDYHVDFWSPTMDNDWEPVERGEFDDVDEPEEVAHLA